MKNFLRGFVLVVGLFGCTTLDYNKQAQLPDVAWQAMCQLLESEEAGYLCMRVMPPEVRYEKLRDGLYGYYDGSDTIVIREGLSEEWELRILIHEQIHYLHTQLQFISVPGGAEEVCWSENEAWTLEGIYSDKDTSRWWVNYPHCWQWYADDQFLIDLGTLYNAVNDLMDEVILEN